MFDRTPETASLAQPEQGVDQVCAVYDRLLARPGGELPPEAAGNLAALAGIYDIDARRPHREVWQDLRAVLTRQPVRDEDAEGSATAVEPAEPMTLLIVEDDAETAADLTAALQDAGHSVVGPFHNAEAAEAAVALHQVDLALLDINLSGETDGGALASALRTRWGLPVMFLSGDLALAARHADLAEAVILKPYTGRDVLTALAGYQAAQRSGSASRETLRPG